VIALGGEDSLTGPALFTVVALARDFPPRNKPGGSKRSEKERATFLRKWLTGP